MSAWWPARGLWKPVAGGGGGRITRLFGVGAQYTISQNLIDDAQNMLLLQKGPKSIPITCPVRLLQVSGPPLPLLHGDERRTDADPLPPLVSAGGCWTQ